MKVRKAGRMIFNQESGRMKGLMKASKNEIKAEEEQRERGASGEYRWRSKKIKEEAMAGKRIYELYK